MASRLYRDKAIILRTHKLGESDRIVTFLGRERGQFRAVGKGVRRTGSRFGARLEPFGVVDAMFHEGRNLDVVTQAQTLHPLGMIIAPDYDLYTAGWVMLESAQRLTEESDPSPVFFDLTLGALVALARRRHAPDLVVGSYLLRALTFQGWQPELDSCFVCGSAAISAFAAEGGALCAVCRGGFQHSLCAPDLFELARALQSADWASADGVDPRAARDLAGLVSRYTSWHIERRLKSVAVREREQR